MSFFLGGENAWGLGTELWPHRFGTRGPGIAPITYDFDAVWIGDEIVHIGEGALSTDSVSIEPHGAELAALLKLNHLVRARSQIDERTMREVALLPFVA